MTFLPTRSAFRPPQGWLLVAAVSILALIPALAAAQGGATVGVGTAGSLGSVLVGPDGRTLYTFDQDSGSVSSCYDACEDAWPPLTVSGAPTAATGVSGTLGTHEREDGSMQVTHNGRPLYYFAGDSAPGEANGQGLQDVWFVITVSATGGTGDNDDDDPAAPPVGNAGLVATNVEESTNVTPLLLAGGLAAAAVALAGGSLAYARRRD